MKGNKKNDFTPKITIFCCENSAYRAADMAGTLGLIIPEGVKIISLPCAGRLEEVHVLNALEEGADGVMVLGCLKDSCKFLNGDARTKKKIDFLKETLSDIGIEKSRVDFFNISPNMGVKFSELVVEMNEKLIEMGPLLARKKNPRGRS
ncbi:MAG: hydrogenase iron-sulfur subunit [Eubacteriales bacterium]|nr:hydrogenase iron-sulfur subunit [Eubacteriales bacterium]